MRDNEQAVSPVVGVMLMLVVTIIIAAVVSAFAGGVAGETKQAPQASLAVRADLADFAVVFEHRGGDALDLNAIAVVFEQEDSKITLTRLDVGTNCMAFEQVGSSSTLVRTGDRFIIRGTDPGWAAGITYGSMSLLDNKRISWSVIDLESSQAVAKGSSAL